MWILSFFTEEGIPSTGLTPLVRILDVATGYTVVDNELMLETGDGFYRYEFDAYEPSRDYAIICDSVTLSGSDRYTYASSGEYHDVLDSIESTVGMVDIRTTLLRKIQTNRLELDDGDTDNWVLYDDDSNTPFLTFSVRDKAGKLIVQQPHTPSRRSMANGDVCGSGIIPSVDIYMRKSVYDPNDDGVISSTASVSDGVYTSTASGIKSAVDQSHLPCILGTKCIDESGIGDQFVIKYDAPTDSLVYDSITNNLHGRESILEGTSQLIVNFIDLGHINYTVVALLENTVDIDPSIYTFMVIDRSSSSFTIGFSDGVVSDNYVLNWSIIVN